MASELEKLTIYDAILRLKSAISNEQLELNEDI
jgi:hypothetical protein